MEGWNLALRVLSIRHRAKRAAVGNPTAPVDVLAITTTPQELSMIRILILMTAVLGLSACETFGGFGRDVSTAGQAVTNTAQDVEDELD